VQRTHLVIEGTWIRGQDASPNHPMALGLKLKRCRIFVYSSHLVQNSAKKCFTYYSCQCIGVCLVPLFCSVTWSYVGSAFSKHPCNRLPLRRSSMPGFIPNSLPLPKLSGKRPMRCYRERGLKFFSQNSIDQKTRPLPLQLCGILHTETHTYGGYTTNQPSHK